MNTKQKLSDPPLSTGPFNAVVKSWFKWPKAPETTQEEIVLNGSTFVGKNALPL